MDDFELDDFESGSCLVNYHTPFATFLSSLTFP